MTVLHLNTVLEPMGPAGALVLTDGQVSLLGGGRRAAVVVRIGARSARLRLAVMGGLNVIGVSRAHRAALGVEIGQAVEAEVSLDEAPRTVEVPDDLATALADHPRLRDAFDALAFTQRRELVDGVEGAKRPDTRVRRIDAIVERLRQQPLPGRGSSDASERPASS